MTLKMFVKIVVSVLTVLVVMVLLDKTLYLVNGTSTLGGLIGSVLILSEVFLGYKSLVSIWKNKKTEKELENEK